MFLISSNFSFIMCGDLKEKKNNFWELKKKTKTIYTHDTANTNSQVHHWSLKIKIYMIYF